MGEAKRRRKASRPKQKTDELVDKLIASQAGTVTQGDIPPHLNVFATMEAAWNELAQDFFEDLPRKQRQDAKFIFYHGVQAAVNLCIYCAGQSKFEAAADQITLDCVNYEKEAEAVLAERKRLIEAPFGNGKAS